MKIRSFFQCCLPVAGIFVLSFGLFAGEPENYYRPAYGKSGYTLKTALHQIIKDHTSLSYNELWTAFETTDRREDGYVWDMYSDCDFTFGTNQCGNYKQEGDCYNREHSFPKSWFDDAKPMYTDLFHLYPTDGYVNGRRSNYPFGEVENPTYTSRAGAKLGPNATAGFSGTVFEPMDEYKGDFARTYFYMATCYEDKIASWSDCPICSGDNRASFDAWTVSLLLAWHEQDPVSDKETERNDAVYSIQKNRNPFIDHPELVEKIWGDDRTPFGSDDPDPDPDTTSVAERMPLRFRLYPNPADACFTVETPDNSRVEIFSTMGVRMSVYRQVNDRVQVCLPVSGLYFVRVTDRTGSTVQRVVIK